MGQEQMSWQGFDWDPGNERKLLARHGIVRSVVEAALRRPHLVKPDPAHSVQEARWVAIAHDDDGRPLFVVYTIRIKGSQRLCRPLSARYMHLKEVESHVEKEA